MAAKREQTTDTILMIRPAHFGPNAQTAGTNVFQHSNKGASIKKIQEKALDEFETFAKKLKSSGVRVIVFDDLSRPPYSPDSIFPNNWISFHADGTVIVYPMLSPNRRFERRVDILEKLEAEYSFKISQIVNLIEHEKSGKFLESTGSLVLDRANRIAYACISARTSPEVLGEFAEKMGYEVVKFTAKGKEGKPIYHTNVMLTIGDKFAILCPGAISSKAEREKVLGSLKKTGHEIVEITIGQLYHFAGNALQIKNMGGEKILVMSTQAFNSLSPEQVKKLERHSRILSSPLDAIEKYGGGSARCMMAEIYLPPK